MAMAIMKSAVDGHILVSCHVTCVTCSIYITFPFRLTTPLPLVFVAPVRARRAGRPGDVLWRGAAGGPVRAPGADAAHHHQLPALAGGLPGAVPTLPAQVLQRRRPAAHRLDRGRRDLPGTRVRGGCDGSTRCGAGDPAVLAVGLTEADTTEGLVFVS